MDGAVYLGEYLNRWKPFFICKRIISGYLLRNFLSFQELMTKKNLQLERMIWLLLSTGEHQLSQIFRYNYSICCCESSLFDS